MHRQFDERWTIWQLGYLGTAYSVASKCKILLQEWQQHMPALTLCCVSSFKYLRRQLKTGRDSAEITSRTAKARAAFANLRHLRHLHDIRISLKKRVYNATVRSVLLYSSETWLIHVEDTRRLSILNHQSPKHCSSLVCVVVFCAQIFVL